MFAPQSKCATLSCWTQEVPGTSRFSTIERTTGAYARKTANPVLVGKYNEESQHRYAPIGDRLFYTSDHIFHSFLCCRITKQFPVVLYFRVVNSFHKLKLCRAI